ncbi:MAG: UvrD-helicase domain-containing protein [Spirochaetes bacterium]|nr:UvrD-helicase domain-containing protein [Spirochaetota bacterium]
MNLLEKLNKNQREAVLHTEGPLLILAGAGSGKTRVITHRIAYLIEKGIRPYNIFAVTFTNKAAEEMKNRVMNIVGPEGNSVFIKTFHSAAAYILRRFGEAINITKNFTIYDMGDQEDLIKKILIDLKLDPKKIRPAMIASKISEIKDKEDYLEGVDPALLLPDYFAFNFAEVFDLYRNKMTENNALDFNDLLCQTVRLLRESKDSLKDMQRMWRYFMIDEYQDTNYSQYLIAKYLSSATKNLCVVGDDDQSIYSWRGADIKNILNFERDNENTKVITLEENYRSTKQILDAAYCVVQNNVNRKNKNIKSSRGDGENITWCIANNEYGEGEFVINNIISLKSREKLSNRDFAIFYRTNAQSRIFEDYLRREKIPYRIIGGMKFYDRKEIKDILAYLKFIVNPNDSISLFRIINTPVRGIGKASQDKISEIARSEGISEWTVIRDELMTGKVPKGLDDFKKIITALMNDLPEVPAQIKLSKFMTDIVEISGYRENLREENTLESSSRIDNINELINSIYDYEQSDLDATPEQFIQDISLYTSEQNPEEKHDCVTLMTVHNAKGLEFPVVFLTGMEENTFPHKFSIDTENGIEEERRLCYVGLTRAMDRIFITNAELRRNFMGTEYKTPSRFIDEIPREYMNMKSYISQMFNRESKFDERFETRPYIQNRDKFKQAASINKNENRNDPSDKIIISSEKKEPEKRESGSRFSLKESVVHPEFGVGKIIKIEGTGDNVKLTIDFGTKKRILLEKYAPLDKLN